MNVGRFGFWRFGWAFFHSNISELLPTTNPTKSSPSLLLLIPMKSKPDSHWLVQLREYSSVPELLTYPKDSQNLHELTIAEGTCTMSLAQTSHNNKSQSLVGHNHPTLQHIQCLQVECARVSGSLLFVRIGLLSESPSLNSSGVLATTWEVASLTSKSLYIDWFVYKCVVNFVIQ